MKRLIIIFSLIFLFSCFNVNATTNTGTFTPCYNLLLNNPNPGNNTEDTSFNITCSIDCNSSTGNIMNLSWFEKQNNNWVHVQNNKSINNGTYNYNFENVTEYNKWYHWKVSLSDGNGNILNESYSFKSTLLEAGFTYSVNGHTITVTPYFGYGINSFKFILKGDNHTISETSWIDYGDIQKHDFIVDFGRDYIVYMFYTVSGETKAIGKTIGVGSAKGCNIDTKADTPDLTISNVETKDKQKKFKNTFEDLELQPIHIGLIVFISVLVIMFLFRSKSKKYLFIRSEKNYGKKRK